MFRTAPKFAESVDAEGKNAAAVALGRTGGKGVLRALNRNVGRVFSPDRKDTHWEKRKAAARRSQVARSRLPSWRLSLRPSRALMHRCGNIR